MADEEEEPFEEVEVSPAKEAFASTTTDHQDQVNDDGDVKPLGHVYDGYELLLDVDESALDDCLPPATGLCSSSVIVVAVVVVVVV